MLRNVHRGVFIRCWPYLWIPWNPVCGSLRVWPPFSRKPGVHPSSIWPIEVLTLGSMASKAIMHLLSVFHKHGGGKHMGTSVQRSESQKLFHPFKQFRTSGIPEGGKGGKCLMHWAGGGWVMTMPVPPPVPAPALKVWVFPSQRGGQALRTCV